MERLTNPHSVILESASCLSSLADLVAAAESLIANDGWLYDLEGTSAREIAELAFQTVASGKMRKEGPTTYQDLGIAWKYRRCTRSNFEGLQGVSRAVKVNLAEWPLRSKAITDDGPAWVMDPRRTLVAFGATGTGKTHLVTGILRDCWQAGMSALWLDCTDFLERLKAAIDGPPGSHAQMIEQAKDVRVLVLDELVTEELTDWERTRLCSILRRRYAIGYPTMLTTNSGVEALYDLDQRIASRMLGEEGVLVPLGGKDRRDPVANDGDLKRRLR